MNDVSLGGVWEVCLQDGSRYPAQLPGTLDENGIGHPGSGANQWHPGETPGSTDDLQGNGQILTRLTRRVDLRRAGVV